MEAQTRSRGQLDAVYEAERRQFSTAQQDVHACRRLWRTVIERTVDDIRFLHRNATKAKLKKHEEERLRRIRENPPEDFVRGPWFDQICDYLQVNPDRVRREILQMESGLSAA